MMPMLRKTRRVCLTWQRRAQALRRCARWINRAVRSNSQADTRPSIHHERISAETAVWIWQTVNSDFFSPQPLVGACQEQVADRTEDQMAFESRIASPFVMVQADLAFVVLEAPLDAPPREGRQKDRSYRRLRQRVAHEKLHLRGIEHVASDHQMPTRPRQTIRPLQVERHVLDFPNHRPFLAVLDSPALPVLLFHRRMPPKQMLDAPRRPTACYDPRHLATASTTATQRPLGDSRRVDPAHQGSRHFGHEWLRALVQRLQKRRFSPIPLVERQPGKMDALGCARSYNSRAISVFGR